MSTPSFERLAWLVEPTSIGEFLSSVFEQRFLHTARNDCSKFDSLMRLTDVDKIMWQQESNLKSIAALFKNNVEQHPDRIVDAVTYKQWVVDEYSKGSTLILKHLQNSLAPVAVMQHDLTKEIAGHVSVNAYVSPPNSTGFLPHYDAHDVFILQIHGKKTWSIHGRSAVLLPLGRPSDLPSIDDLGNRPQLIALCPGDTLYIPRGHIHSAATDAAESMHLTVGVRPALWSDVLKGAIDEISKDDLALRSSVIASDEPLAGHPLVQVLLRAIEKSRACDAMATILGTLRRQVTLKLSALPDAAASRFETIPQITSSTLVARRTGALVSIQKGESTVDITFPGLGSPDHGGSIEAPRTTEQMFNFIADNFGVFRVDELPGPLSIKSKCEFVSELLRLGLLRTVRIGCDRAE